MAICSLYCDFNETLLSLVSKDTGLPRCIMGTIPPAVLLLLMLLLGLVELFKKRRLQTDNHGRTLLPDLESNSVEEIISAPGKSCKYRKPCRGVKKQYEMLSSSIQAITNPAGFVHGDNRTSFLYTLQQFLHICLVFVPIADLIVKGTIEPQRIQGYVMFMDVAMLLTWMLTFSVLRSQSARYFKAHVSRHSFGLLLFWSLAFVVENLSFISWNNPHWWFQRSTKIKEAEFGLFISRYVLKLFIFLLGLKGPGLYKPLEVPIEEEKKFLEGSTVIQVFASDLTFPFEWLKFTVLDW